MKLYLFGSPRIEQGGKPIEISRRKPKALLTYLATQPQRHSRETLVALFWPEYGRQQARADLSRTLSVLRKSLGKEWLSADRGAVAIDVHKGMWVDVTHFRHLIANCQSHAHPITAVCASCIAPLTEAISLYQADFLAGFTLSDSPAFDDWQLFETEALRKELASAMERLAWAHGQQGEFDLAVDYARRWVGMEPLHEPTHRMLMCVFALGNQRAAALAQNESCRHILKSELGVEPAQATSALYERILSRRQGDAGLVPPLPSPSFLGESKDSDTERTIFIERKRELAQLNRAQTSMLAGQGQVAFAIGEAGRGKTSLLQEFAYPPSACCSTWAGALDGTPSY